MKLFSIDIMDDCESYSEIRVGINEEDVTNKIIVEDNYSCIMWIKAIEIKEIDGYKVIFNEDKKINLSL